VSTRYDVVVCGAGPAGLAAAAAAAAAGARVALIDAQANPGGQIWRPSVLLPPTAAARRAMTRTLGAGRVDFRPQAQVIAAGEGEVLIESTQSAERLRYCSLVIATGARELLLPFPGWTLPGVTGAGGLQALAKQGWPLAGRRVVVAGSGPLLLAAAASLHRHGARVLAVLEQAPPAAIRRFASRLTLWPGQALQALALRATLRAAPYRCGEHVRSAHGATQLEQVEVCGRRGSYAIRCDHLAIGYGLVPNIELAQLLGCRLDESRAHARVITDDCMRTSVRGVYAAGEVRGIGGWQAARIEGEIAGHAAAGALRPVAALQRRLRLRRRFAQLLEDCFTLDERVRTLADADTVICRCEQVPLRALAGYADLRAAKLATRCGMGPCQGRICGAALAATGHLARDRVRVPLFPARLSTLADSFDIAAAETDA